MKSTMGLWVAVIVVALIAIAGLVYPVAKDAGVFGAAATCDGSQSTTCLDGNFKLTNGGLQMSSSTACVMYNATSTATPLRLRFLTVSTTSSDGFVTWSYGTCI